MINTILFPSSFFDTKVVDEDLQMEYTAVKNTGLFQTIIFGYDGWFHENRLVLTDVPEEPIRAVYRGWMMLPEQYERFYELLLEKNIRLITTPEEYRLFHVFPNVYPLFGEDTAKMLVYPKETIVDLEEVKDTFERFMIKDYVKSVKGTDFPKYFTNDVDQETFNQWMDVFMKYRGNLFTGGICVKEFFDLRYYGESVNEYRTFFINNKIATISKNSAQPIYAEEPPQELLEKYRNLNSHFYTIDCAERDDGSWKILEAGDGSVSGLSENQDYEAFFRTLYYCLN